MNGLRSGGALVIAGVVAIVGAAVLAGLDFAKIVRRSFAGSSTR